MPNRSDKIRIQNALLALIEAGPYFAVDYPAGSKIASDVDPLIDTPIVPPSAQVNELDAGFEVDTRYGRSLVLDRPQWLWLGKVKFDREVTAYHAEELWQADPPILVKTTDFRQATLVLQRTTYGHPIKQSAHNGTLIEFTFGVRLGRR